MPNHKEETIGKVVELCLLEWGFDLTFTTTANNAYDYLRRKTRDTKGFILSREFLHKKCHADILNRIVQDSLKNLNESIFML